MDGSERDSDTTLGSWVSVSGNQESQGGSSDDNSAASNDYDPNPTEARHEMQAVVDETEATAPPGTTHLDASNSNAEHDGENGDGSNDGEGSGSSSGFVIPTARPLVMDVYEHAEVHPASGGGTQRRRKGHQQQQQQSDHQSQSQHPPTQAPSRIRRRSTHTSSILRNPLYVFGTFTVVAYLMRPNSSQISTPDASFGSAKFYDDPWDQGEDFRDRSPIPDEWKRKQARTEKALAAKRKKMEEEEEARRKNATSSEEEIVDGEQKDKEVEAETSSANETKSETMANVTRINITSFEAVVDPFPQLYDWQNWTTRLANETEADTFATDPVFLWFAPQSGGGAFVKILEGCYEGINITRSQWWRYETLDDADATDSANAGANSWGWQYDTPPPDDAGRLPIMATTNLLEAASSAFNSSAGRGRCISLFMHPIERAIRSYHHHHRMIYSRTARNNASATSNSTYNITLASYAQGAFAEENRLVRSIVDRNSSEALQWKDLEAAMDFVTRKCLVGVIGDKRNLLVRTIALIEMALGLTKRERNSTRCTAELSFWADSMHEISNQRIDLPSDDTEAWDALMKKNAYDMKLYEKVTELFANQTTLLNETRASRSKVKPNALDQDGRTDNDTIPATETKSKPYSRPTNTTDDLEGVVAEALENSPVDEEVDDEIEEEEEEEEEEERADDDEENTDNDETEETGNGGDKEGETPYVDDSNVT